MVRINWEDLYTYFFHGNLYEIRLVRSLTPTCQKPRGVLTNSCKYIPVPSSNTRTSNPKPAEYIRCTTQNLIPIQNNNY